MGNCFHKNEEKKDIQEFYCPNCEEKPSEIAEILRIHPDIGKILILCPKKGEEHFLTLEKYNQKMKTSNNNKNFKCDANDCKNENGINNIYCPKCKCFLCKDCADKDKIDNLEKYKDEIIKIKNNKKCGFLCFWRLSCVNDNKHPNECIHIHIKQNELSTTCQNHGLKTNQYCQECERYVCEKCSDKILT